MEYKSEAKYVRTSPRKLREVVTLIKKQPLEQMLVNLEFMEQKAASILLKALKSAIANVENNLSLTSDKLKLKQLVINEGPSFKRWRPASRGRAHPYKRRTSHIKIILTDYSNDQIPSPNVTVGMPTKRRRTKSQTNSKSKIQMSKV